MKLLALALLVGLMAGCHGGSEWSRTYDPPAQLPSYTPTATATTFVVPATAYESVHADIDAMHHSLVDDDMTEAAKAFRAKRTALALRIPDAGRAVFLGTSGFDVDDEPDLESLREGCSGFAQTIGADSASLSYFVTAERVGVTLFSYNHLYKMYRVSATYWRHLDGMK